jgi:hypothetical protein
VRTKIAIVAALALVVVASWVAWDRVGRTPFPADTTPDGAYLRVVIAVGDGRPRDMFAYVETDAQWAAYTIRDLRAKTCARIRASYPAAEGAKLLDAYRAEAEAADGADVLALLAARDGSLARLRRDLSGVKSVEVSGDRATVVTARGTRYPFRRRDNGIWGLTMFTANLLAEADRAARDLAVVSASADDYDRAAKSSP